MKKYKVTLTTEERAMLRDLVSVGKAAARRITHATVAGGREFMRAARRTMPSSGRCKSARRPSAGFAARGTRTRSALKPVQSQKLDGEGEAFLVGGAGTLKLLADRLVECDIVESRGTGKKNELKPTAIRRKAMPTSSARWKPGGVPVTSPTRCWFASAHQGNPHADAAATGASGEMTTNTSATASPVHAVRASRWLAACQGHGPSSEGRLGGIDQGTGGRPLPGQTQDRVGDGQFEHPQTLKHSTRGGASDRRAPGNPFHPGQLRTWPKWSWRVNALIAASETNAS